MTQVHFLLLDHRDPHGAHAAIRARAEEHLHGEPSPRAKEALLPVNRPAATDWGKSVQHAVTKDKGFTFHDHIGDGPKDGYMVSVQKDTEHAVPVRDLTPEMLADYRDTNQQALADPNNFLGGWVYKGKAYLDISRHVPDQAQALALARQHNQIGIYDIGKGQTLLTSDYPEQQEQRAAMVIVAKDDDLAAVNALRKAAGLPPLVHDTLSVVQRTALRLVGRSGS